MDVIIKYTIILSAFLCFSILINKLFLRFSKNMGIRHVDESLIRWSSTTKPAFGGISFYIIFLLSLAVYPIVFSQYEPFFNLQLLGIVAAISLGFIMGLADDAYNTNPLLKFSTQVLCGIVLISTGTFIEIFSLSWLNYLLTIIWVVGLMNSINMLDNMDAVASVAVLSSIVSIFIAVLFQTTVTGIYAFVLIAIAVAVLGFLIFNWHPSKMYMGDTGSQFLGISLAALSIIFLWNYNGPTARNNIAQQFLLPLLAFLVPISDTTTVFINRISKGKSPFIGGKDHTTHYLSYFGIKDAGIALVIGGIGLLSLVGIFLILFLEEWTKISIIVCTIYVLITFFTLFIITHLKTDIPK